MADLNTKTFWKEIAPRVLKAAIWGSLTFLVIYYLPMMLYPQELIPIDYATPLIQFATIAVFFTVAGQLFSGTIIGCGFGVAKAIVIIAYFFALTNDGIFSVTLPISDATVKVAVDISIFLLMIIAVNLLGVAKNILEAISILTEKATENNIT
jgi:hypothetical protein